jgi:hypothetical protein
MRIGRSALFSRFDPALAQHPMKTTRGPSARQARLCFPDRRRTRMAALTLQQTSNAAAPAGASRHASDFERDMIALLPVLRAFSSSLCGRQGIADDMVQNALVNAWRARPLRAGLEHEGMALYHRAQRILFACAPRLARNPL